MLELLPLCVLLGLVLAALALSFWREVKKRRPCRLIRLFRPAGPARP